MLGSMSGRVLKWAGRALTMAAAIGMGVYFSVVGPRTFMAVYCAQARRAVLAMSAMCARQGLSRRVSVVVAGCRCRRGVRRVHPGGAGPATQLGQGRRARCRPG